MVLMKKTCYYKVLKDYKTVIMLSINISYITFCILLERGKAEPYHDMVSFRTHPGIRGGRGKAKEI